MKDLLLGIIYSFFIFFNYYTIGSEMPLIF